MAGSRYDHIPQQGWAYLGAALRGLNADLAAVEAGGGGGQFVLLAYGESPPDPPEAGKIYLRPLTAPPTDSTPPTVPSDLSASAVTATGFTVTWTASTDNVAVTGYEYRLDASSQSVAVESTTAVVSGLNAATGYTFDVRARDAAGNRSDWSVPLAVTTAASTDTTPPGVPTDLAASAVTATGFTLSWSAPSGDPTGYEYRLDGGTPVTVTGATTADVAGLAAATAYDVDVRARDAAGNWSAWSATVEVTTAAASAATVSIFGASPPGTVATHTDGPATCGNAFYHVRNGETLSVVGARIFVPAGAPSSFLTSAVDVWAWQPAYTDTAGVSGAEVTAASSGTPTATFTNLVEGWNEVTFPAPLSMVRYAAATANNCVFILTRYQNSDYMSTTGLPDGFIASADLTGLVLAEQFFPRSVNNFSGNATATYPIDILVEDPTP